MNLVFTKAFTDGELNFRIMSETAESLQSLMKEHNITVADLEFIVKFLINEKITPQLAMRRIKTFDVLKEKIEDNTEREETIKNLQQQIEEQEQKLKEELSSKETELEQKLTEKEEVLKGILNEKTKIETEKSELENMTDLFESEREELKNQLKMLQKMQFEDEQQEEGYQNEFKKVAENFIKDLKPLINKHETIQDMLTPIIEQLEVMTSDNISYAFESNAYDVLLNRVILQLMEGDIKPTPIATVKPTPKDTKSKKSKPEKEEVVVSTPKKPVKEVKVDQRVVQVLDLFLDFLEEAEDDKSFQDRVSTIAEMDEAYEHLGSIGLSQVYSFVSKDISKKEELEKLLTSWKKEGVPR